MNFNCPRIREDNKIHPEDFVSNRETTDIFNILYKITHGQEVTENEYQRIFGYVPGQLE